MEVQILYLMDCPWCVKTKEIVRQTLKELGIKATVEEILIDTKQKATKYHFRGSPTVRINEKDVQDEVAKGKCVACEKLSSEQKAKKFVRKECFMGCRVYLYKGRRYPYPPKGMLKEAIRAFYESKG
ncbi:MAG: DUF2703 domain-containing protein [Candidatus Aenigmatarchaeota archaeon]